MFGMESDGKRVVWKVGFLLGAMLVSQCYIALVSGVRTLQGLEDVKTHTTRHGARSDISKPNCQPPTDGGLLGSPPSPLGSFGTPPSPTGSNGTPPSPTISYVSPPSHDPSYHTPPSTGGSYGTPPSTGGSYGTPPLHDPSHHTPPSTGASYRTPPSSGGSYVTPPSSGGSYGTQPRHDPSNHSPPSHHRSHRTPPTHGGGGYYSPPSTNPPASPTPSVPVDPPTPDTPSPILTPPSLPNFPPITGTCDFWRNHPGMIWGMLGYWSNMGNMFGLPTTNMFGGNPTIPQALSNKRTDGFGALLREGTAAFLNTMANHKFPFTTQQVRNSFTAAMVSEKTAAAQAEKFRMANEGKNK